MLVQRGRDVVTATAPMIGHLRPEIGTAGGQAHAILAIVPMPEAIVQQRHAPVITAADIARPNECILDFQNLLVARLIE